MQPLKIINAASNIDYTKEKLMKTDGESNGEDETIEIIPLTPSAQTSVVAPKVSFPEVDIAAATHRGLIRANNEDHYLALRVTRSLETLFTNVSEGMLEPSFNEIGYGMLVADGMGGMASGEVASRTALCKLVDLVVNTPDWFMKINHNEGAAVVMDRMTQRFRQIDKTLREQASRDRSLSGMGTTLTVAVSLATALLIGHIGDSRAYLLRRNRLHQLTRDDTLAQALVDSGIARPEDTATRAMRHVLTAAIGSTGEQTDPQVQRLNLIDEDQVLLCTDGLTEVVSAETIASTLRDAETAQSACQSLIDLALAGGAPDNVTVILARYRFSN
jgi:protein phosphatase